MMTKYAVPLTFIFSYDREAKAWASIACEIYVGSCGDSVDEAREMLKEALEIHISSAVELGQVEDLGFPIPSENLSHLINVPPSDLVIEYHTMLLTVKIEPKPELTSLEFLRSSVKPVGCQFQVAA